jgi:hypothetical protein
VSRKIGVARRPHERSPAGNSSRYDSRLFASLYHQPPFPIDTNRWVFVPSYSPYSWKVKGEEEEDSRRKKLLISGGINKQAAGGDS